METKKQQIINLYENENISFDLIAHRCKCDVVYVKRIIKLYEN